MFLNTSAPQSDYMGLLRTSGDVSHFFLRVIVAVEFAPHERRCFRLIWCKRYCQFVCSARAEMFLGYISSLV